MNINQVYSAVQNGREVFTGKLTTIQNIKGREFPRYRLEDARGNYCWFWKNEVTFFDPKDAPKAYIPTAEERGKEASGYHTTFKGH